MPVVPIAAAVITVGAEVYSGVSQKRGADAAARTSQQVADYNARVDRSDAAQVDLDAQENIRAMRRDAATYMSRQTSAYAANGVRVDSGSPLAVRVATAGRFAQREQQAWSDSQAKEQRLESQAQAGIAEGAAKADQYHREGVGAVLNGASKVAGSVFDAYEGGAFSSFGKSSVGTGTNNPSASLAD